MRQFSFKLVSESSSTLFLVLDFYALDQFINPSFLVRTIKISTHSRCIKREVVTFQTLLCTYYPTHAYIINYDSNIFPRLSQTCTLSKYWVKLAIFSSTVKLHGKSKIVQRRCSQTLSPFEVKIPLDHYIIPPIVKFKGRVISESCFPSVKCKTNSLSFT